MKLTRASGILLHPTSLPGPFAIGTLGPEAEDFVDFLVAGGQSLWQILPLTPTGYGDSPYSAFSAFAGNPLLIDLRQLAAAGDLDSADLEAEGGDPAAVDYGRSHATVDRLLPRAAGRFFAAGGTPRHEAYARFAAEQAYWLNDYAIFQALRRHFKGEPWYRWPPELRHRREAALQEWGERLAAEIAREKYAQFVFFDQWFALRSYANERGIRVLGDMPIFVALDSADVWANPAAFKLDSELRPTVVAGVPPDYFSETGQRWGNPLYDWEQMQRDGFSWWLARLRWSLAQTDLVRIDHFRGFQACWEVPAEEETAVNGEWRQVPGEALFRRIAEEFEDIPIVAEDLGLITPEVEALRDRFGLPGMKVLHFAFGSGADNPYLPHNLTRHSVVYTGTHDNDTTLGWWLELPTAEKQALRNYLGCGIRDMPWDLIRLAQSTVADLAVIPLQDVLGLDSRARMNRPGQGGANWAWRYTARELDNDHARRLADLARVYGRKS